MNNKENGTSQETNQHKSDYLYTVVDDRGVEIAFEQVPETVVSLQPSNTEILYELGVGDKVIGVTEYDKWPEEVQHVEKVSDITTVNVERVVELNPDVIFAYITGGEEQLEQLESTGLKVFVIKPANSIDDVYGDIQQIAQVMGVEEKGNELVEKIKAQFAGIKEKTDSIEQKKKYILKLH